MKVRLVALGAGDKTLDCDLCLLPSLSHDPVLGPLVYMLWAHLEKDYLTIMGRICFWCNGAMQRRYKGWKVREVKDLRAP